MDNLTHSLVGLFLARAGLRNATPRGTAIMVLAANAPDFDVVCWFGGAATYIRWHRNITHSLIAIPVMALLTVAIVRLLGRRPVRWMPATLIAVVGVISHILLDLTNVYGVRLLLPFTGHWFHWDLTQVIDFSIWAMLLLGVIAPGLGRLVGSEIGERSHGVGAGWAVFSLLLLIGYDYGRSILHDHAVALMDSRIFHGLSPRRVGAFPDSNPLRWTGIAELSDSYVEVPIRLGENFHPESGATFYKAERTPAINASLATDAFQAFLQFVQYPVWVNEPDPEDASAHRVRLVDLRFGNPGEPGFQAIASINRSNQVVSSVFTFGQPRSR